MSTFRPVRIGDLGRVVTGRTPPAASPSEFGGDIPFVTPTDIDGASRFLTTERAVSAAWDSQQGRISLPARAVCVVCIGATIGKICMTSTRSQSNQQINSVIVHEAFDPFFVYYKLSTLKNIFRQWATGAATPIINKSAFSDIVVEVPSLHEQRRIASILSAYDDLIEVNRRRVAILEEMARRLFEEWFVHLRFSGHEAVAVHDTSNGPLPEGWSCRPLGQLVTEERDTVLPVDLDRGTMYVGLEHIPRRSTTLTEWGNVEDVVSTKLRFRRGDILFGKIRPYFHKIAIAPAHGVSSTDAIVLRSRASEHAGIVAAVAASDAFVAHAVQTSNGTKMPRANWTVLARYPVRIPPEPLLNQFNSCVIDGINQAISLAAANTRLAAARDLLLPRLVSGELSVADAPIPDRLLEAAD